MIPIFRVPVARRKKETETPPREKTYSYHEVENILLCVISGLNSASLIRDNDIEVLCEPDAIERGLVVHIRQGDKYMVMRTLIERSSEK